MLKRQVSGIPEVQEDLEDEHSAKNDDDDDEYFDHSQAIDEKLKEESVNL